MAERAVRFGVKSSSGLQAATWKVWTPGPPKNDVYLACRALRGELKASLHESGHWHIAFSPAFYERRFADEDTRPSSRFTDEWSRPAEIAPGLTLAYRVVVPWFSATIKPEKEARGIAWVPSAPKGQAIQFAVLITAPSARASSWPSKNSMNSKFVGTISLGSGEMVWVVYTTEPFPLPASMRGTAQFFEGHDASSLKSATLRAVLFGDEKDGSRKMYDVPVVIGKEGSG
jgi:hypothetical protein